MANKSIEDLYSALFAIQESIQDATQLAAEAANIAGMFGGEISRVVTDQLNTYFIPSVAKYAEDADTPGSIVPLITFLDSVPLAMTREEPKPEVATPPPATNAQLAEPPTEQPAEGSFAAQAQQQESSKKKGKARLAEAAVEDQAYALLYQLTTGFAGGIPRADIQDMWEQTSLPSAYGAKADANDIIDFLVAEGFAQDDGGIIRITGSGDGYLGAMEESRFSEKLQGEFLVYLDSILFSTEIVGNVSEETAKYFLLEEHPDWPERIVVKKNW